MARAKVETVKIKITKFGDGKVSSGIHVNGEGDVMLSAGETVDVSKKTAQALEDRGFAEII